MEYTIFVLSLNNDEMKHFTQAEQYHKNVIIGQVLKSSDKTYGKSCQP